MQEYRMKSSRWDKLIVRNNMKKLYIVQKYIMAESIKDALRVESQYRPTECFINGDFLKNNFITSDLKKKSTKPHISQSRKSVRK